MKSIYHRTPPRKLFISATSATRVVWNLLSVLDTTVYNVSIMLQLISARNVIKTARSQQKLILDTTDINDSSNQRMKVELTVPTIRIAHVQPINMVASWPQKLPTLTSPSCQFNAPSQECPAGCRTIMVLLFWTELEGFIEEFARPERKVILAFHSHLVIWLLRQP